MAFAERALNNREIYDLLIRIDEGYLITDNEMEMLCSVTSIDWSLSNITELPKSMSLLISLTNLDLSNTQVMDINALTKLVFLTHLDLSGTQVRDIQALSKLVFLTHLDLSETQVIDIRELSKLTSLTNLDLSRTQVSDIRALSKLTSLTNLNLSNTQVIGISALTNLIFLTHLDLSGTRVRDIRALSKLTSLTNINLSKTQVIDIRELSKLISLTNINLSETQVIDIRELSKLTSLMNLNLSFTQVSDIRALSKLTSLTNLNLSNTQVIGISALTNLIFLTHLDLSGTRVRDIRALSKLTSLTNLDLSGTRVIDIRELSKLTSLTNINLSKTQVIDIRELSKLTSLTNINLSETQVIDIRELSKLTSLMNLNLSFTQVSDIRALSKLTSLVDLNLSFMPVENISVLSNLTSLVNLDLGGTKVRDIRALGKLTFLLNLNLSFTHVKNISELTNLTSLAVLNLGGTQVSDIRALSNLTFLTNLNLSFTQVKNIVELTNLILLTTLDLRKTKVSDISALTNLISLMNLNLEGTSVSDISVLAKLTSLTNLNLGGTKVSNISALSKQKFLSDLILWGTQVSDISVLIQLTSLANLNLSGTQVSDISALSGLKNLKTLDLSGIEIKNLNDLSRLFALKRLNIQNSKTISIPESLLDLNMNFIAKETGFFFSNDEGIYIHGLTLADQPIEIFSQNRELIRAYYREGDQVPVNECKVIFLGDAESGKTHSIRRLLNNGEFLKDFDGESTPGIEITVNPAKLDNTDIVINYWDFGGQEIQHSMHRVFLTERTVYVVFLNARQDDLMDERAGYWMENIKAFAPDAPVLVVINKIDQNEHPRFNEKGFIDSYGEQVKKVIRLSAKTDEKQVFLEKLQGNINSIIMDLPTVSKKIPRSWKNLMENVREMTDHYLTTEQFIKKCQTNSIKNYEEIHDELVDLFQVIGISFCYYQNRAVADYLLLNPKWMLNALYTIVTNGKAVAQNGVITQDNLYDLLEKDSLNGFTVRRVIPELRYKGFEVNYILGVIRMFSLSYGLREGSEFFPMLCDGDEKISVKDAVPGDALHFIFRYTYLPTNVMHRLIVEMQRDLDYRYVWYTGGVFRNTQQNQAAYIHSKGNDLHIYVYGEDAYYNPNEYLTPISNIVRNINKDMGISATEFLTCRNDRSEAEIPLKRVKGNILNGIYKEYNETLEEIIDYKNLSRRYFDNGLKSSSLLKSVVFALQAMQRDKTYYDSDENSRNRFVSSNLNAQLKGTNLRCFDQLPGGTSPKGKAPGVRDIVIKNENGQEVMIYEGINLTGINRTRIDEHIDKILGNYNPQGQPYNILVVYLECGLDKFKTIADEYKEHIAEHAPESFSCIGKPHDVSIEGEYIRCMKMQYEASGIYFTIYHIIVRMGQ